MTPLEAAQAAVEAAQEEIDGQRALLRPLLDRRRELRSALISLPRRTARAAERLALQTELGALLYDLRPLTIMHRRLVERLQRARAVRQQLAAARPEHPDVFLITGGAGDDSRHLSATARVRLKIA